MLTDTEITQASSRLVSGKLKPEDTDALVSIFRMAFAGIDVANNYEYELKLSELDDSANQKKSAAQVAAILIKLKSFGFGVSELTGVRGAGVKFKELDRYIEHVLFAFSKLYPIPVEFSKFDIKRSLLFGSSSNNGSSGRHSSSSVVTERQ